ncbi:MAG: tRNA pseudouridine(38-40) synthase TruA [Planctomycetes bacterium]|nr:tRNA pseudouridine(38-40) synthase TruA [Planctomycetota bacterium]
MSGTAERNLKLTLEYDGTDFHGWQAQPDCRTVEGVLREALRGLTGESPQIHGASRTDQGVHALGQAASFQTASPVPTERFALALNGKLPPDVRVLRCEEVEPGFSARFTALAKRYRYTIDRRGVPSVFLARYAHHHAGRLDLERMGSAARLFEGEHDFASYQCASGQPRETTVRTIHAVRILERSGRLDVEVWGSSFLYKMVRTMAGTLLEVARGRWPPWRVAEILRSPGSESPGPTLPGKGLCLLEVYYDLRALEESLAGAGPGDGGPPARGLTDSGPRT